MTTEAIPVQREAVIDQESEASTEADRTSIHYSIFANKAVFEGVTPRQVADLNALSPDSGMTLGLGYRLSRPDNMFRSPFVDAMYLWFAYSQSYIAQSSSDPYDFSELEARRVDATLNLVFEEAHDEEFENGVESKFSESLSAIVNLHEQVAVGAIGRKLKARNIGIEVLIEALRQIGQLDHEPTRPIRLKLLEPYLRNDNIRIRYAACLGLAALDDGAAISALRRALDAEPSDKIRVILLKVLNQVENI